MRPEDGPLAVLLELQRRQPRGPLREDSMALWLLTRVALDQGFGRDREDRLRRRAVLLGQRLRRMALSPVMQRGLATALGHLEEGSPSAARIALAQMVAPVRDQLGSEAAEALAQAARFIHDRQRRGEDQTG